VSESQSPVPPASIFREYDIRGVVGVDLTEATATQIAGGVLLAGSLVARQRVRPLSKGPGPSAAGLLGQRVRTTKPTD